MVDHAVYKELVLSNRIIFFTARLIHKRISNVHIPNLVVVIILETLLTGLAVLIWKIAGVAIAPAATLWAYWGCLLSGICLVLVETNLNRFLQTVSNYSVQMLGSNQYLLEQWLKKWFDLRRQVLFSVFFTLIIFPTAFYFFSLTLGTQAQFWTSPILFTNLFFIGNALYWIMVLPNVARLISRNAQRIGAFDPRNIIWIDELSDIYQRAALSTSLVGVALITPVALGPRGNTPVQVVTLGWLVLVWALVLIPYVIAQTALSQFVNRERLLTMNEIQVLLHKLLIRNSEVNNSSQAEMLLKIYKEAQEADNSVWGFRSSLKFINSLLLPTLSFVVINFTQLVEIVRQFFH